MEFSCFHGIDVQDAFVLQYALRRIEKNKKQKKKRDDFYQFFHVHHVIVRAKKII